MNTEYRSIVTFMMVKITLYNILLYSDLTTKIIMMANFFLYILLSMLKYY